jgi:hypothetical protein
MDANPIFPGWGLFMLALPVIGILVFAVFGVDERLFTPTRNPARRRFFCEVGGNNGPFLSDPDGRAWHKEPIRRIDATLIRADRADSDAIPNRANASVIRGYIIDL